MNTVCLIGRLTRDPELKTTPSGLTVTSMRIAVDRAGAKDGDGYKAGFFDVSAFGRTAELAAQYLGKGREVGVTGSLSFREWETQDGAKRTAVEIRAFDVTFVGKPGDGASGGEQWSDDGQGSLAGTSASGDSQAADDDIPF